MSKTKYSVTLTGRVHSGMDAPTVWRRVTQLLKLDTQTFHQRVLTRLPVTLQAVTQEQALRQHEALMSCGADARVLPEGATPRVWLHIEQSTRGPLSMNYARLAVQERLVPAGTRACLQHGKQWHALETLLEVNPPATTKPATEYPPQPEATQASPRRNKRPGRVIALVVVAVVVVLIVALALWTRR